MPAPKLGKWANPDGRVKRLSRGRIYMLPVSNPQAWGLPPHIRQKVVWLCAKCPAAHQVEFDKQPCQVMVVGRRQAQRQSA